MDNNSIVVTSYDIPESADGIGAVQDGEKAFIFGFKTRRQIFSQLGYITVPEDDKNLTACANAICGMVRMKALLRAMTIAPEELFAELDEQIKSDPITERNLAIVLTAVRQAVADYASNKDK